MATNVTCRFLRANPPSCDETYAEHVGGPFDIAQGIYVIAAVLISIRTFYYTAIIIKRKKFYPIGTQIAVAELDPLAR